MERHLDQLSAQLSFRCISERDNPIARKGYKINSQHEEDGIIEEIFSRIGINRPNFIEIGADMASFENNSAALAMRGCKGVWVDMNEPKIHADKSKLKCISMKVTPKNIGKLLEESNKFLMPEQCNLLSLDIDSNDYYILSEITKLQKFEVPKSIFPVKEAHLHSDMNWKKET